MTKRERVYEAARRLVNCGQNPQPGTSTWHESMERLYQRLITEIQLTATDEIDLDGVEIRHAIGIDK